MFSVAQVGVEPTASLVLSQGGLPVAYRANGILLLFGKEGLEPSLPDSNSGCLPLARSLNVTLQMKTKPLLLLN